MRPTVEVFTEIYANGDGLVPPGLYGKELNDAKKLVTDFCRGFNSRQPLSIFEDTSATGPSGAGGKSSSLVSLLSFASGLISWQCRLKAIERQSLPQRHCRKAIWCGILCLAPGSTAERFLAGQAHRDDGPPSGFTPESSAIPFHGATLTPCPRESRIWDTFASVSTENAPTQLDSTPIGPSHNSALQSSSIPNDSVQKQSHPGQSKARHDPPKYPRSTG